MQNVQSQRVGILGGGQLARMLHEAACRLGLSPIVLAETPNDPAAQLCPSAIFGGWRDPVALKRFLSQVDLVVFENEFVDAELLEEIALPGARPSFTPALPVIRETQNKLRQKKLFKKLGIPTSPFEEYEGGKLESWVKAQLDRRGGQCVFKWAMFGYDGKGTAIAPSQVEAVSFCKAAIDKGIAVYCEDKIRFRRELAILSSHSVRGEMVSWPLLVSEQKDGICRLVTGPASALGVPLAMDELAQEYARKLARELPVHGTFAIELFHTGSGELLANEMAPRVHNSGHFSQDASDTSQFENHWRAVLGMPLGGTGCVPAFAMLNLIGPAGSGAVNRPPRPTGGIHLHWYRKSEMREGRKMGHLNAQAGSAAELKAVVAELKRCESEWAAEMRGK